MGIRLFRDVTPGPMLLLARTIRAGGLWTVVGIAAALVLLVIAYAIPGLPFDLSAVFRVLWPSALLMALSGSSGLTIDGLLIIGLSLGANGLLYGLIASVAEGVSLGASRGRRSLSVVGTSCCILAVLLMLRLTLFRGTISPVGFPGPLS